MIKTNQLFEKMSPALAEEFLGFFYAQQKQAVNVAIQTMAVKRKMRPIFVQRMIPQKRYQWLQKELGRRDNVTIAENLLQTWFMETQNAMLCDFMDSLGIEHNEKGEVENMPSEMTKAKLSKGIDALLEKYDAEKVVLYIHTIPALSMAEWPALFQLLVDEERLRFPGQTEPLVSADDLSTKAESAPAASEKEKAAPKAKAKSKSDAVDKEVAETKPAPAKKASAKKDDSTEAETKAPAAKKTAAKKASTETEAAKAPAKKAAAPKKASAAKAAPADNKTPKSAPKQKHSKNPSNH